MYIEEIDKLVSEQKYQQALIHIDIALKDNINSIDLYQRRSNVLYFLGRYEESLYASETCMSLGGKSIWTYARRGLILFQMGVFSEALKFLGHACDQGLENTEVYFAYAMSLKEFDIERSIKFFRKAVELNRSVIFRDWNIQMASVNSILSQRLKSWIYNKDTRYTRISSLLNKNNAKIYAQKKQLKVPKTYMVTSSFGDITLDSFPNRVVIKPEDGHSSQGCFVVDNGIDLFTLKKYQIN